MTSEQYYRAEQAHLRCLAQQQQHHDEYVAQVAQAELDHRCAGQTQEVQASCGRVLESFAFHAQVKS